MMRNLHGDFIWYELMTPDPLGAKAFYDAVIGWDIAAEGRTMPNGSDYRQITAQDGNHSGGVLKLTREMTEAGARPSWIGYIGVDDVDATVAKAREHGARLDMPPRDMEGVGRMAMLADPFGAPFYVMRGFPDEESKAYQMMSPGHVAWNELCTPEPDSARTFYYGLFDWTDGETMPMGELGIYQMFDRNGQTIGAMMPAMSGAQEPGWLFYFAVEDLDAACRATSLNGGTVLEEPQEIPGGMFMIRARDPQGAAFALVGPRIS